MKTITVTNFSIDRKIIIPINQILYIEEVKENITNIWFNNHEMKGITVKENFETVKNLINNPEGQE